ncbi:hypothetical protein IW261DRAFT_1568596 [Armillaria novae-zelandiae]|uniref:Uncharacterized protein n=1 Tax=Armillaria novae-zelandiae TaxID=153914 RepID=A0AA39NZL6_9AGAR|nr:hypothetical protein IW261DRAFT_1568596 [Armillaria novae-zelandiae]
MVQIAQDIAFPKANMFFLRTLEHIVTAAVMTFKGFCIRDPVGSLRCKATVDDFCTVSRLIQIVRFVGEESEVAP